MYCSHCGKEISEDATFCPNCGSRVKGSPVPPRQTGRDEFFDAPPRPAPEQQTPAQSTGTNTYALVGFVLSFLIAIAGLICSIIGLQQCTRYNGNGKGLAIAGIIISAVSIATSVIAVILSLVFHLYYWDYSYWY